MSNVLERFRMKFWKRTCGNAFSVWRSGIYNVMNGMINELDAQRNVALQSKSNVREQIKDHNAMRALRIIRKSVLGDFYQGWRNVIT